MRFRINIEVVLEVPTLRHAQDALARVEQSLVEMLGPTVVEDAGAVSRAELAPVDQAAADAFTADGLGPGISSQRRSVDL